MWNLNCDKFLQLHVCQVRLIWHIRLSWNNIMALIWNINPIKYATSTLNKHMKLQSFHRPFVHVPTFACWFWKEHVPSMIIYNSLWRTSKMQNIVFYEEVAEISRTSSTLKWVNLVFEQPTPHNFYQLRRFFIYISKRLW